MQSLNTIEIAHTIIHQDAFGRYCLNDLHKASGGEKRHQPSDWLRIQQTQELIDEVAIPGIPGIVAKQGLGTFAVKELVYAYAMWISPTFHIAVIRAYDALVTGAATPAPAQPTIAASESVACIEIIARMLNFSESGKVTALQNFLKDNHPALLPTLPDYVIDAPDGAGSSMVTKSATDLLRERELPVSAQAFNKLAELAGYLATVERTGSKGDIKKFKAVTDHGKTYGKNVIASVNAKETQPHWYEERFDELLNELGLVAA